MFFLFFRVFGFVIYLLICIAIGKGADRWNRSFAKYFILSLIFSPLLIGIILILLGNNKVKNSSSGSLYPASYSNTSLINSYSGPVWTCPKCSDKNPMSNSFCKGCGEYKPLGVVSDKKFENDIPAVHNTGDEWICKNCNEKNPINSMFCKDCGTYK